MSGDPATWQEVVPVRVPCGSHGCAFGPRRGLVGRVGDVLDFAGPLAFGAAAWLAACRLTWLMRWLKTSDDETVELDPVG